MPGSTPLLTLHEDVKTKREGDDTGPQDLDSHQDEIEGTCPRKSVESPGIDKAESENEWSFVDLYK